jgi:hypothetical protein
LVVRSATTCPIGRIRSTGEVEFNTPAHALIEKGDRLTVIADDGEHLDVGTDGSPEGAAPYRVDPIPLDIEPREEHFLILGWDALGAYLVEKGRSSTTPDSTIQVVYDPRVFEPEELQNAEDDITWTPARGDLWRLSDVSRTREFTTIVILGYRRRMSVEEADSRTLLNLMLVRRDLESWDRPAPRVLVELLDADNVPLARMTGADDYLVSDTIGSRAVVQLAEEPERGAFFFSLYDGDGPSVPLIPAERTGLNGTVPKSERLRWQQGSLPSAGVGRLSEVGRSLSTPISTTRSRSRTATRSSSLADCRAAPQWPRAARPACNSATSGSDPTSRRYVGCG